MRVLFSEGTYVEAVSGSPTTWLRLLAIRCLSCLFATRRRELVPGGNHHRAHAPSPGPSQGRMADLLRVWMGYVFSYLTEAP